jgi:ribonuclease P protein component
MPGESRTLPRLGPGPSRPPHGGAFAVDAHGADVATRPGTAIALPGRAGRPTAACHRLQTELRQGVRREAHLPAQHAPAGAQARVSGADAHPRRAGDHQVPPVEGPDSAVGLIGRIGDRRAFDRLAREGRRARSETLWCTYLDDPDTVPPRVAFAIGRPVGTAVVRNRLRRRLRTLVHTIAGRAPLDHGWLLIGARPAAVELSFDELESELAGLLARCAPPAPLTTDRGSSH